MYTVARWDGVCTLLLDRTVCVYTVAKGDDVCTLLLDGTVCEHCC